MLELYDERRALCLEASTLLWCMRIWVVGQRQRIGMDWRIHDTLARLEASDATPCLESFMVALSHEATRRTAVKHIDYPLVSKDERLLLDVFGLAQEARSFEALVRLRGLLNPEGARAALRSAEGDRIGSRPSRPVPIGARNRGVPLRARGRGRPMCRVRTALMPILGRCQKPGAVQTAQVSMPCGQMAESAAHHRVCAACRVL